MSDPSNELSAALARLRSDDAATRNEGVKAVLRLGPAAVPALLALLGEPSPDLRADAMYALARIADRRAAGAFEEGLRDEEERVRAYAAQGLARINHEGALRASLQTLNDAPDPMHLDTTPSVGALGEMGLAAAPPLLELLMSEDELTRLRAQRALELILNRRHGFRPGQGFPSPEAERQARDEWRANGNYAYTDDAAARADAVEKWRAWLAAQER